MDVENRELPVQCSKCGKRRRGRKWIHVSPRAGEGRVSHGYCPGCAQETLTQMFGDTEAAHIVDSVQSQVWNG